MAENNIQINPKKSSELEFDVVISGIDATNIPVVRFVISAGDCDYSFKCGKIEGEKSKWIAKMPPLSHIKTETAPFRVEVIIDDYYFEPAEGEITFITAPEVKFTSKNTPKPSVTASFTVKQEEEEKEEPKKKAGTGKYFTKDEVRAHGKKKVAEDLQEATSGGGEITGMYAPNNSLLKPEEDPTKNGRMRGDTSVNDEFTDEDRLSLDKAEEIGTPSPGEGRAYQQEDGKPREGKIVPPEEDEEFDPKKVAEDIVKSALGKLPKATVKGTLFKRDSSGKTVIKGLESEKTTQTLKDNAQKVKDILKSS
jgi:hypothetical protein